MYHTRLGPAVGNRIVQFLHQCLYLTLAVEYIFGGLWRKGWKGTFLMGIFLNTKNVSLRSLLERAQYADENNCRKNHKVRDRRMLDFPGSSNRLLCRWFFIDCLTEKHGFFGVSSAQH